MGKLIINIKAVSKQPGVDIKEKAIQIVKAYGSIYKTEEVPIGFGISSFKITLISPDSVSTDEMEEAFSKIEDIDISIEDVSVLPEIWFIV